MSKSAPKSDTTSVEFREPPFRHRYDWSAVADALRKRPGEWAVVFENDRASLVVAIRMGHIRAMRSDEGIEVRTAKNVRPDAGPRLCEMWARYVPEKDTNQKGSK